MTNDISNKVLYHVIMYSAKNIDTEEEIDKFDRLYYNLMDAPYKTRSYIVRGYKVDENGKVVKIYLDGDVLFVGGIQDE